MEPEYIIYESKINYMTTEQLAKLTPNENLATLNKLFNIYKSENKAHKSIFKALTNKLILLDMEMPLNGKNKAQKIRYNAKRDMYIYNQVIQGKMINVKSSRSLKVVEEARREFCLSKGLVIKEEDLTK